ncbi:hypothetical protein IT570_05090 [Candidatus Sumerlaeota bacterium]|nr:hypothetical protein [Candidatus Sumerlaeota bacterium]
MALTLLKWIEMFSAFVAISGERWQVVVSVNVLDGSHPLRLDEKDRLTIPSKLVSIIREIEGLNESDSIEVVVTLIRNRLAIFPRKVFEKRMEKMTGLPRATMVNYRDSQSLDKLNRVRIPAMHAQVLNLVDDVVMMGSETHLEVVSRQAWVKQALERMQDMPETWEPLD